MYICDPSVTLVIYIMEHFPHALYVVGLNGHAAVKHVIDGHHRYAAAHKLINLGIVEVHAGDDNSVKASV